MNQGTKTSVGWAEDAPQAGVDDEAHRTDHQHVEDERIDIALDVQRFDHQLTDAGDASPLSRDLDADGEFGGMPFHFRGDACP